MELTEKIDSINRQLIDSFGIDTISGQPIWRVVWSEEQFEKRLGTYDDFTSEGIFLRTVTEVREVPKYRQWIKKRYVLERLVIIPDVNLKELPSTKLSYEPIWVFETQRGMYLPPRLDISKFIIDSVYSAMGKKNFAKEKEDLSIEKKQQEIIELQMDLFGNETEIGDALAYKQAVIVPHKQFGENN